MAEREELRVSPEVEKLLREKLADPTQPTSQRFRALFVLSNLRGPAVRQALLGALRDSSNLLAHEAAFALGQMQDPEAVPALVEVLEDLSVHDSVRHMAAEALGAIGLEVCIPALQRRLSSDPSEEVRQTSEIALRRIEEASKGKGAPSSCWISSPFLSVDPALPSTRTTFVDQLRKLLLDENEQLYESYAALFSLRNHGSQEPTDAIVSALHVKNALLRHEVAYVLGQLQNKSTSAALSQLVKDPNEHPMVRHEAAEALGSIADHGSAELLKEFTRDPEPMVSQSCEVALSMIEFERSVLLHAAARSNYVGSETPRLPNAEKVVDKIPQLLVNKGEGRVGTR